MVLFCHMLMIKKEIICVNLSATNPLKISKEIHYSIFNYSLPFPPTLPSTLATSLLPPACSIFFSAADLSYITIFAYSEIFFLSPNFPSSLVLSVGPLILTAVILVFYFLFRGHLYIYPQFSLV